MENIINKHFQNVLIAQDLKANVQTIGRIVRNEILLDSDPENAEKVDTIFATNRQFIDELLNEPDISQSNNLQLVLEISQLLEDYYTVVENSLFSPYCDLEIKLIEKICDAIGITMNRILDQVSLEDIVLFVKRQFTPLARNKKLDFEVKLEPTVPTLLLTDEHRLKQILNNLLANAFKFTEEGKIKLHIKVNDERTKVIFAISDTGIGISKNKLTRIFEDFYQADSTTSRKYGGTGLGLPISKELAHLLNGEIKVESVEGKGSTFSLYIGNIDAADFTDLIEEKSFSHSELVSIMEKNGKLTIRTYSSNECVKLEISDEGKGIDPQIIDKIGTPFFTTKDKGTGLGMAICYSIAARHNAEIDFTTSSEGTTFTITFPIIKEDE